MWISGVDQWPSGLNFQFSGLLMTNEMWHPIVLRAKLLTNQVAASSYAHRKVTQLVDEEGVLLVMQLLHNSILHIT